MMLKSMILMAVVITSTYQEGAGPTKQEPVQQVAILPTLPQAFIDTTYRDPRTVEEILGDPTTFQPQPGLSAAQGVAIQDATVDDDMKLPIRFKAFSTRGNPTAMLTPITVTIGNPLLGLWTPRTVDTPPGIDGYFVAAGPLGTTTLTVSGVNSRNQTITSVLNITVVGGPATSIVIEVLPAEVQ